MSKEIKYVIVDDCYPILFSCAQQHSDFSKFKITSAGFCKIYKQDGGKYVVNCYGESINLKLSSNKHDNKRIESILNNY